LLIVGSTPAAADIHQEIVSARAQLDRLNNQSEAAAERYNAARIKLATAEQRAATAQDALRHADASVARQATAVRAFARQSYETGGLSPTLTLLTDGSAHEMVDRQSALQAIAHSQQQMLARYASSRRTQQGAQSMATAIVAQQRAATRAALKEKQTIQRNAAQAQHLLSMLRAKELQLHRAAAAAQLAAEQQRTAAAARAFASQSVNPSSPPPPAHVSNNAVQTAISTARAQLGKPYVWGAAGPDSFDCSGLTMYAYAAAGISLAHYTGDQWNEGRHVSESQLQPGDLVFFNTDAPLGHEGMYLGGGEFIHAPHTGTVVQIATLSGYYQDTYAGAVRVVG
jgi:cell wall-associated NlpC family hydrolase